MSEFMMMLLLSENEAVDVRDALLKAAEEDEDAGKAWYHKKRLAAAHQRRALHLKRAADAIRPIDQLGL